MAYGTPRNTAEIEPYYTDIRRGRPPSAEQLAELDRRYAAIGGLSPLHERTEAQRDAIAAALEERAPGRFVVELGHAPRRAVDRARCRRARRRGVDRDRRPGARPALLDDVGGDVPRAGGPCGRGSAAVGFVGIERWGLLDAYVAFLAGRVRDAVATMPANTKVVFTAHSLPTRILATGDPYPLEVRATASAVAVAAGLGRWSGWSAAWQSAGRTADAWLGPDILEVIDDLGPAENADGLLVCPCGFVADHLEVLFDLDVQARRARRGGRSDVRPHRRRERRPRRDERAGRPDRRNMNRRVVVVGGGIAGVTVAERLSAALAPQLADGAITVELLDDGPQPGGKLRTTPFAGRPAVDEGADAFLARVPHASDLAARLGLERSLASPATGAAFVWHGRLHPIPDGLALGLPGRVLPLVTSRLLSVRGIARAAAEPLLPRRPDGDSVGRLVRSRFGTEVHERLVDPLVGSIYATDTDRFSLAMVPQLATLAASTQPAARGPRRPITGGGDRAGVRRTGGGHAAAGDGRRRAGRGRRRHRGQRRARCTIVAADGPRWRVDDEPADVVVLATPAATTAPLIGKAAADLAARLGAMNHCRRRHRHPGRRRRVAGRVAWAQRLPRAQARPGAGDRRLVRLAEVGPLARRGRGAARVDRP